MKKQFLIIVAVFLSNTFGVSQRIMATPLTNLPEITSPVSAVYVLGDDV
jgi:hypothetical protein